MHRGLRQLVWLKVLAQDIQKWRKFHSFLVAGQATAPKLVKQEEKQSLALTLPDNLPGALYEALSACLAWY